MSTPRDEWQWFGHPAHFICARDCQFHMATKVGNYLVSTVGELWGDRQVREIHADVHDKKWFVENRYRKGDDFDNAYMKRFGFQEIGCDRKYETFVFKAGEPCTTPECNCGLPALADACELDSAPANDAGTATKNHMRLCDEYASRES